MESHTKKTCVRAIQSHFFIQKYLQNQYIQYIKIHRLYDKLAILVRYTGFSVKTKKVNINGQTSVGDSHTHGVSRNDRSILSITTATKIEINLVVTMIVQWLTDTIIKYYQN